MKISNDPREQEAFDLVKQFLTELDACKTEKERIFKVLELVSGISKAVRKQTTKETPK